MRRPYTDMPRQDRDSVPGRFMGTVSFACVTRIIHLPGDIFRTGKMRRLGGDSQSCSRRQRHYRDHLRKSADPKNSRARQD